MPEKTTKKKTKAKKSSAGKKRLRPSVKIILAVLAVLILVFAGIRIYRWNAQRGDSRVIVLVNPWNTVDNSDFTPSLQTVDGVQVDKSCAGELEKLLADCRAAGVSIKLSAGYRSAEEQLQVFEDEVSRQMQSGYSADTAYAMAEQNVGASGTSEHELGLAVDVEGEAAQGWMQENAWRYGFILRYPEGSEAVTGRSADSAHFRYVGLTAAEQINSLGITLEEYMGMFYTQDAEVEVTN